MKQIFGLTGLTRPRGRRVLVAPVLLSMLLGLISMTGAGSPAKAALQSDTICTTPALVAFPLEDIDESATPIADPVATPLASPVASPVADSVIPVGDEDDVQDEAVQIEQLVREIGACQDERRVRTLTRYVTEDFLGDFYAGGGAISEDQFVELARSLPRVPVEIVSVSDIEIADEGQATAEVVSRIGHQLIRAEWRFVFVPEEEADATGSEPVFGVWLADGVEPLPVEAPEGANEVAVELDEYAYDPASLTVEGPDIVIEAENTGDDDHELLVLELADDVTTRELLTAPGPELPRGVTVVGQATIPAGTEGELVLVDMEPGSYAIVDLLLTDDGTPHLALGMEATLTVE